MRACLRVFLTRGYGDGFLRGQGAVAQLIFGDLLRFFGYPLRFFCCNLLLDFLFQRFFFLVGVIQIAKAVGRYVELRVAGVAGGGLEAVEKQAGGLVVDLAGEECIEDVTDGELDGMRVFQQRELERQLEARGTALALDAFTGGLMEETVWVIAESRGFAEVAVRPSRDRSIGLLNSRVPSSLIGSLVNPTRSGSRVFSIS